METLNLGAGPNDNTGDDLRAGGAKINANFAEVEAALAALEAYVDSSVAGLLDLKGSTDCSANPNYPAASKGDAYYVTVAGKIGGASGKSVDVGDVYIAYADNAGGTEASVGTSWFVLEHNRTDAGSPIGPHQIYIPAGAMRIRTTNGAAAGSAETTTNKIMVDSLDFDQTTQEYAQFGMAMPKSWDEGTVTAFFVWTTTAASGAVVWGLQAVARGDGDAIDAAWGAAQEVTDTCLGADLSHHTAATAAITIAGTPAEGDRVTFQVYRKAADGADTLAADAKLLGVMMTITTNAATDA